MSGSSSEAVSMITGTRLVLSSARTRWSTSRPFRRGILKSRRMSFGGVSEWPSPYRYSSASTPSRQTCTWLAKWCWLKAWSASSTSSWLSSTRRTSICLSEFDIGVLQSEMECGAKVGFGLRPDPPTVALDDSLHGRQADTGAFVILGPVQALEDAEQASRVLHVEADSVVPHEVGRRRLRRVAADDDLRNLDVSAELQRIADQVGVDLSEE